MSTTGLTGAPSLARLAPGGGPYAPAPAAQLGSIGGFLSDLGEGAANLGARAAAFAGNPIGALVAGQWLDLPRAVKKVLIGAILENAETVVDAVQGKVLAVVPVPGMDRLWPLMREFLLGFIRRMREVGENRRVDMSDRLARLMAGGSATFMLHLVKGLGLGLWDVVKLPYDLVGAAIDGMKFVARLLDNMTGQDLLEGLNLIASAQTALQAGIGHLLTNPAQAIKILDAIWDSIGATVGQIGRGLAQALIEMIHLPDAKLGEELGRLTAPFIVDAVLTFFTGGGAVIRQAIAKFAQIAAKVTPLLRAVRLVGKALAAAKQTLRLVKAIVAPLRGGLDKIAMLFAKSGAGPWLARFGAWLDRFGDAADLALTGAALHQKGSNTPDEAVAAGDVSLAETAEGVPVANLESAEKRPPTREEEAEFVQVAELTASEVFAGLGFKDYSAEREGPEFALYGIASKHLLLKVESNAIGVFLIKRDRLLMTLIHARKSLLGRAASLRAKAKALAGTDPATAAKYQKLADKLTGGAGAKRSEAIGARTATHGLKEHLALGRLRPKYAGEGPGTLDLVYELPSGELAIVEAKGGKSGLGMKEVAPGVSARQGSAAYLLHTIEEMKAAGGKDREIALKLEAAWKSGNVRYYLSETAIPKSGVPKNVSLSEFPMSSHAEATSFLRKRRSRFFKPVGSGVPKKKKLPTKKGKP